MPTTRNVPPRPAQAPAGAILWLAATAHCGTTPNTPPRTAPHHAATHPGPGPGGPAPATPPDPTPAQSVASEQDQRTVAAGLNALGADLFARLRARPGNLAFAPASIAVAFGMAASGARGPTADELRHVLHHELDPATTQAALGALAQGWNTTPEGLSNGVEVRTADRLFGQRGFAFEPAFLAATARTFGAPLEAVDFATEAEPARQRINAWVAQQTRDHIRDLLPPDGVTGDTRLVLVDAVYFKGRWADAFAPTATRDEAFRVNGTQPVPVPTMHRTGHYGYLARDGVRILELPYHGGRYALDVVLPDRPDGLAALETRWTAQASAAWLGALAPTEVAVALPRFRIAPELVRLREHVEALGARLAWDRARADFTGIAGARNPADRLALSGAFHKAYIDVNEEGTEAAAATGVGMVLMSATAGPGPVRFQADRPFLFLVRDRHSGATLFMGRVTDPRAPTA